MPNFNTSLIQYVVDRGNFTTAMRCQRGVVGEPGNSDDRKTIQVAEFHLLLVS